MEKELRARLDVVRQQQPLDAAPLVSRSTTGENSPAASPAAGRSAETADLSQEQIDEIKTEIEIEEAIREKMEVEADNIDFTESFVNEAQSQAKVIAEQKRSLRMLE